MLPNRSTGANSTLDSGVVTLPASPPTAYTKRAAEVAWIADDDSARRATFSAGPGRGADRLKELLVMPTAENSAYTPSTLVTRATHTSPAVSAPVSKLALCVQPVVQLS